MRSRALAAVVVVVVGMIPAAGCSSDHSTADGEHASATSTASGQAADIAFAQLMIPHHQQAVEMADLALDPRAQASPRVLDLADQIKAAQDPEIKTMTGWLQQWGAPTTMPGADASGTTSDHSGHDMGGMAMSGMMTAEQMATLAEARGEAFDSQWLTMMIAHHEGALAMAEQVKQTSTDPQVVALADAIVSAQEAEIAQMKQYLGDSG